MPAVRTINSCMESLPAPPGPAESSPPRLLLPLPRTHPPIDAESSLSTFPSSPGAKLLTWLPSAAPQMAMQACIPPCPHSVRPPWTLTNSTCPVLSRAKSLMKEMIRRTRQRIPLCVNKVGPMHSFQANTAKFALL